MGLAKNTAIAFATSAVITVGLIAIGTKSDKEQKPETTYPTTTSTIPQTTTTTTTIALPPPPPITTTSTIAETTTTDIATTTTNSEATTTATVPIIKVAIPPTTIRKVTPISLPATE